MKKSRGEFKAAGAPCILVLVGDEACGLEDRRERPRAACGVPQLVQKFAMVNPPAYFISRCLYEARPGLLRDGAVHVHEILPWLAGGRIDRHRTAG